MLTLSQFLCLHATVMGKILGWADFLQQCLRNEQRPLEVNMFKQVWELNKMSLKCLSGVFQSRGSDASWQ